jgi:hypothetical protein
MELRLEFKFSRLLIGLFSTALNPNFPEKLYIEREMLENAHVLEMVYGFNIK